MINKLARKETANIRPNKMKGNQKKSILIQVISDTWKERHHSGVVINFH
jgi:hypothetical protein